MKFYFIRHGEIPSNTKRVYAGRSEEELTPRGIIQAERAASKLTMISVDAVYSSPLRRAIQTAEIIGNHHKKEPIPEESFIEMRLGPWEGLSEDEIAREYKHEWQIWNHKPRDLVLKDRETLDQLQERVLNGIKQIRNANSFKSVVVVSHVAIIRVLLIHLQKMDLNKYRTIPVRNGEIFSLEGL